MILVSVRYQNISRTCALLAFKEKQIIGLISRGVLALEAMWGNLSDILTRYPWVSRPAKNHGSLIYWML